MKTIFEKVGGSYSEVNDYEMVAPFQAKIACVFLFSVIKSVHGKCN